MTDHEILRRLRVLLSMHPDERPISVDRLEKLVGVDDCVYDAMRRKGFHAQTRIRLARALTLVENDQVVAKRAGIKPFEITIRPPQPPVRIVPVIEFSGAPPKIRFLAQNPNAFPEPLVKKDDRPASYTGFLRGKKRRDRVSEG